MKRYTAAPAIAFGLCLLGCPADDDEGPNGGADEVTLVTFNAGLAFGYVEEASGRIDPIITAVSGLDADVVCLQEMWVSQDADLNWNPMVIEQILDGVSGTFPNSYYSRTFAADDAELTGCSIEEAEPLEACALANCGDVPPENIADCVLVDCFDEFDATSAGCQQCMVGNLGQPIEDIIAACKGVVASGVAYDGHNGLALISRLPLTGTEIREMEYVLTARSILHGAVETEGGNSLDVYCTHIASDLSASGLTYPDGELYGSYEEENRGQASEVLNFAESASSENIALMGDFNHGPAVAGGRAELEANYQMMVDAGYADPIAEQGESCSFCDRNLLLDGQGETGELIDHIYLDVAGEVTSAAIVLDGAVDIVGADGMNRQVNLSDHFGVQVDITF